MKKDQAREDLKEEANAQTAKMIAQINQIKEKSPAQQKNPRISEVLNVNFDMNNESEMLLDFDEDDLNFGDQALLNRLSRHQTFGERDSQLLSTPDKSGVTESKNNHFKAFGDKQQISPETAQQTGTQQIATTSTFQTDSTKKQSLFNKNQDREHEGGVQSNQRPKLLHNKLVEDQSPQSSSQQPDIFSHLTPQKTNTQQEVSSSTQEKEGEESKTATFESKVNFKCEMSRESRQDLQADCDLNLPDSPDFLLNDNMDDQSSSLLKDDSVNQNNFLLEQSNRSPQNSQPQVSPHPIQKINSEESRGSSGQEIEKSASSILQQQHPIPLANAMDATNASGVISPDWSMFEKVCVLGEGAYGTVYKVKSLKTSILSGDQDGGRVELNALTSNMKLKIRQQTLGVNMHSSVQKGNKVRSLIMDQFYVIKEIDTANLPKEAALEALNEIETLSETDSHFIVGYIDSFITETCINIIMEYCQHGDLSSTIKKQHPRPFADNFIWKVFIQICLGVHYLHSKGKIHRDLKSLNVFLTKDNSAKIGDLGNAQTIQEKGVEEAKLVEPGQPLEKIGEEVEQENTDFEMSQKPPEKVGTPFYLAPELWQDKLCSKSSDIWALGVILYELCAQKYPYEAQNIDELKQKVISQKYQAIPNQVTKDFIPIIKQCLQKRPESRPSIDEIIFLASFQLKAKVNKITLPRQLNKEKLLQMIQTKKSLPEEDCRMIQELVQKGFLPNKFSINPAESGAFVPQNQQLLEQPEEKNHSGILAPKNPQKHTSGPNSRPGSSSALHSPNPKAHQQGSSNILGQKRGSTTSDTHLPLFPDKISSEAAIGQAAADNSVSQQNQGAQVVVGSCTSARVSNNKNLDDKQRQSGLHSQQQVVGSGGVAQSGSSITSQRRIRTKSLYQGSNISNLKGNGAQINAFAAPSLTSNLNKQEQPDKIAKKADLKEQTHQAPLVSQSQRSKLKLPTQTRTSKLRAAARQNTFVGSESRALLGGIQTPSDAAQSRFGGNKKLNSVSGLKPVAQFSHQAGGFSAANRTKKFLDTDIIEGVEEEIGMVCITEPNDNDEDLFDIADGQSDEMVFDERPSTPKDGERRSLIHKRPKDLLLEDSKKDKNSGDKMKVKGRKIIGSAGGSSSTVGSKVPLQRSGTNSRLNSQTGITSTTNNANQGGGTGVSGSVFGATKRNSMYQNSSKLVPKEGGASSNPLAGSSKVASNSKLGQRQTAGGGASGKQLPLKPSGFTFGLAGHKPKQPSEPFQAASDSHSGQPPPNRVKSRSMMKSPSANQLGHRLSKVSAPDTNFAAKNHLKSTSAILKAPLTNRTSGAGAGASAFGSTVNNANKNSSTSGIPSRTSGIQRKNTQTGGSFLGRATGQQSGVGGLGRNLVSAREIQKKTSLIENSGQIAHKPEASTTSHAQKRVSYKGVVPSSQQQSRVTGGASKSNFTQATSSNTQQSAAFRHSNKGTTASNHNQGARHSAVTGKQQSTSNSLLQQTSEEKKKGAKIQPSKIQVNKFRLGSTTVEGEKEEEETKNDDTVLHKESDTREKIATDQAAPVDPNLSGAQQRLENAYAKLDLQICDEVVDESELYSRHQLTKSNKNAAHMPSIEHFNEAAKKELSLRISQSSKQNNDIIDLEKPQSQQKSFKSATQAFNSFIEQPSSNANNILLEPAKTENSKLQSFVQPSSSMKNEDIFADQNAIVSPKSPESPIILQITNTNATEIADNKEKCDFNDLTEVQSAKLDAITKDLPLRTQSAFLPATSTKAGISLLDDTEDNNHGFGLDLPGDHDTNQEKLDNRQAGTDLLLNLDDDFQTPAANSGKFQMRSAQDNTTNEALLNGMLLDDEHCSNEIDDVGKSGQKKDGVLGGTQKNSHRRNNIYEQDEMLI